MWLYLRPRYYREPSSEHLLLLLNLKYCFVFSCPKSLQPRIISSVCCRVATTKPTVGGNGYELNMSVQWRKHAQYCVINSYFKDWQREAIACNLKCKRYSVRGAVQKEYHELTPGRSRRAAGGSQTDLFQRVQLYICWQHTARRATPDRSRRTPLIKQLLNVSKCKKFSTAVKEWARCSSCGYCSGPGLWSFIWFCRKYPVMAAAWNCDCWITIDLLHVTWGWQHGRSFAENRHTVPIISP